MSQGARAQGNLALFGESESHLPVKNKPLAEVLRPMEWTEFSGLDSLDQTLVRQIKSGQGRPPSLILWGPPGCGKTTFAKLVGRSFPCRFVEFSAVLGGVKEVREIVAEAETSNTPTILFVDEIHRFNKAQQDAFLPHIEKGTISLIGATTENPSFSLTSALCSRCKIVVLSGLAETSLQEILDRAATKLSLKFSSDAARMVVELAGGDARRLLNFLESVAVSGVQKPGKDFEITAEALDAFLKDAKTLFYDRSGEEHYNMVSAFIKSMRGSDPDAALYWGFRMLESGEDPRFVIRRMVIFASEDVGNADPRALQVAIATHQAYELVGLPEGKIPIAQCITYLATAPKSNRSYKAMHEVLGAIKTDPRAIVPKHLRNAPTKLMKSLSYGEGYQYPHDHEGGYAAGVSYLPDKIKGSIYYHPSERGYEKMIGERMKLLKAGKVGSEG